MAEEIVWVDWKRRRFSRLMAELAGYINDREQRVVWRGLQHGAGDRVDKA